MEDVELPSMDIIPDLFELVRNQANFSLLVKICGLLEINFHIV